MISDSLLGYLFNIQAHIPLSLLLLVLTPTPTYGGGNQNPIASPLAIQPCY